MNNDRKLEVLRELTKIAIATPTAGRSGQQMDTMPKPQVQVNQDSVAAATIPAANRKIALVSPKGKNTAGLKVKPPKVNTAKFGTNMKMASVDQKELLKQRLIESYMEKQGFAWLAPVGQGLLQAGRLALPWIAKNVFRRGAQKAVQKGATNQATKQIVSKSIPEAQRLKNVTQPANTGKNFLQGLREGATPGRLGGNTLRESGKAARETLKQTRQAADKIPGAAGKTPKLFRNPKVDNKLLPNQLRDQVIKGPGKGRIAGQGPNTHYTRIKRPAGDHVRHKTIARGVNPTRVSNPARGQSPYVQTGNTVRYNPPTTEAGKQFAQKAYAQNQRALRMGELANTAGRVAGTAGRWGTNTVVGGGTVMGAVKGGEAAWKGLGPGGVAEAAGKGFADGTMVPQISHALGGPTTKATKDAGGFALTPNADKAIQTRLANKPGPVDEARKAANEGNVDALNAAQARAGTGVVYDAQFRPLRGEALKKALAERKAKESKSALEKFRSRKPTTSAYEDLMKLKQDKALGIGGQ